MRIALMGDLHYYIPTNNQLIEKSGFHNLFYKNFLNEFFKKDCDYYISIGDLTHFGTYEEFKDIYSQINQYKGAMRFQQILGNHDAVSRPKSEIERQLGYPLYQSIDHDEAKLIFLDTTKEMSPKDWGGVIDFKQLEWLEHELMESGSKPVLVFGHHPLFNTTEYSMDDLMYIENSKKVLEVLKNKNGVGLFFNGHNHTNSIANDQKWYYVQTGAVLCSLSYRIIEVNNSDISIDTIFINDDIIDQNRYLTATHLEGFTIIPTEQANGKAIDHTLSIDLSKQSFDSSTYSC